MAEPVTVARSLSAAEQAEWERLIAEPRRYPDALRSNWLGQVYDAGLKARGI